MNIKSLIRLSPLGDEVKKELLSKADTISEGQKYVLSGVLWEAVKDVYDLKIQNDENVLLNEVSEGKRKYAINDFSEIEAKAISFLNQDILKAQTDEEIDNVRNQISYFTNKKP
jgi:hypothetical protein